MAISRLLKGRIKFNPNVIYKLPAEELNNEVVEFAMSQPRFSFKDATQYPNIFLNEVFVENYINSEYFKEGSNLVRVTINLDKYSDELKRNIINKIIKSDFKVDATSINLDIYKNHPDLYIHMLKKNNGEAPRFSRRYSNNKSQNISFDTFSVEDIDEIYQILNSDGRNVRYSSIPHYLRTEKMLEKYLAERFIETIDSFNSQVEDINSKEYIVVKKYFMNNISRNLEYFSHMSKKMNMQFSEEEKEKIIEVARKTPIIIDKDTPEFLLKDKEVFINALACSDDISCIEKFDFSEMELTEEDKEKIAEKIEGLPLLKVIKEKDTVLKKLYLEVPGVIEKIVDDIPEFYNYLSMKGKNFYCSKAPTVQYGEYISSDYTSANIFIKKGNGAFLVETLRRNFDLILRNNYLRTADFVPTQEEKMQIYLIAKEKGYVVTEDSPLFFKRNPYLLAEAVMKENVRVANYLFERFTEEDWSIYNKLISGTKDENEMSTTTISDVVQYLIDNNALIGILGEAWEDSKYSFKVGNSNIPGIKQAICSPEFVVKSIQKSFATIVNYNEMYANLNDFTDEDFKKIYDEVIKNGFENRFDLLEVYEIVKENPYVILDLYERTGSVLPTTIGTYLDEKHKQKIADLYWEKKGTTLNKNSLDIEKRNPFIILESIKRDVNSIDYVILDDVDRKEEIEELILEKIKTGEYVLNPNTNKSILLSTNVIDYIIEDSNFSSIYLFDQKQIFLPKQEEQIKNKILDYIRAGNKLEKKVPINFSNEEILEILRKDPNAITKINFYVTSFNGNTEEEIKFKQECEEILLAAVKEGSLIPSKALFAKISGLGNVEEELLKQDISCALYINSWVDGLAQKYVPEVLSALEAGTLKVENEIHLSSLVINKNSNQDGYSINEDLFKYIVTKNPNLIKSMLLATYTEYASESELEEYILKYIDFSRIEVLEEESLAWLGVSEKIYFECIKQNKNVLNHPGIDDVTRQLSSKMKLQELQTLSEMLRQLNNGIYLDLNNDDDYRKILEDVRLIDKVNPNIRYSIRINKRLEKIEQLLIENGYELNENTIFAFRHNPRIILESVKKNPESIKFAIEQDMPKETQDEILKILLESDKKVRLNNKSFRFLKRNFDYIKYSLEEATLEEISEVLESVCFDEDENVNDKISDLINSYIMENKFIPSKRMDPKVYNKILENEEIFFHALKQDIRILKDSKLQLLWYTKEQQEIVYKAFKENEEEYKKDSDLLKLMRNNSFYIMEYVRNHWEELDLVSFDGLQLTEEFKTEVKEYYLANGIVVNENTPKFLRIDHDFIYRYIKSNDGKLAGLNVLEVAPLLNFSEIQKHPEYLELSHFYNEYKSGYEQYFKKWGKEKTLEYASKIGDLVRYLDYSKEYELEEIYKLFEELILNKNDLTEKETLEILSTIPIKLTSDYFKKNSNFRINDAIFLNVLQSNPELISEYEGENENVIQMAVNNGLIISEDLLKKNTIAKSSVIFKKILEENLNLFSYYRGNDEKIINTATEKGFFKDKTDEELTEIFERNNYYHKSKALFMHLLDEYDVSIYKRYLGEDEEVFKKMIEKGFFDKKSEEEFINEIELMYTLPYSDVIFLEALEKYSCEMTRLYKGKSIDVIKRGIEKGFKIDFDFFINRPEFIKNKELVDEGIKNDKFCQGFGIYELSKNLEQNKDKIISAIQSIIGEEHYKKIIPNSDIENEILNLCTISGSEINGVKLLKNMDYDLMNKLGFEEWKKVIKYSFNNPDNRELITLIENKECINFLEIYKNLNGLIEDDKAFGVNKFLKFVSLYNINPTLLKDIDEKIKSGAELTEEEKSDLQIIMYGENHKLKSVIRLEQLGNITEIEIDKNLKRLKDPKISSKDRIKNDLSSFLFNMDDIDINRLLKRDINTQTIIRIMERAKKEGNASLYNDAQYMYLLIDIIEQFKAADLSKDELIKFAENIYSSDPKKLSKIRKSFFNIRELVRKFYEREAQSELTNIASLMNNPEFVEMNGEDIIIDLSKSKHTLYAHVLGISIHDFFYRDNGKVTICVSPETDLHEAYFCGEPKGVVIVGYDHLVRGAFIGSSTINMSSNGRIDNNNYSDDVVREVYLQKSIRDSYEENDIGYSGHAETLLYRKDLIPSCIILTGDEPTEYERNAKNEIEAIINRGLAKNDPDYKVIPFVRTQKHKNRVYSYQKELPNEGFQNEYSTKQDERVDELRKKFYSILGFSKNAEKVIRKSDDEQYVIQNDTVYIIQDLPPEKIELKKAASVLQNMIHGENEVKGLDIITVDVKNSKGDYEKKTAIRDIDARNMWHYNRKNGNLSPKANQLFMQEFLLDHLMCNYESSNAAFLLDSNNNVYGIDKTKSFSAINDFILKDGKTYTNMSYMYFDASEGNNIYRKIFESYILAENPEEVLSRESILEFLQTADKISKMEDDEYLKIFSGYLETINDDEIAENTRKVILERKQNLAKDSSAFIERLEKLREIEHEVIEIESSENVAFINDIHGNAEALKAILEDCRKKGKKNLFILGDLIGFGPQSDECLDIIREAQEEFEISCVLGNHELYSLMGNKSFLNNGGVFEEENTTKVRKSLSAENRSFIESFPLTRKVTIEGKKIELTHFPIKKVFEKDSKVYFAHGEAYTSENVNLGENQEFLIYGHEHRTEATVNDEVGTVDISNIGNTAFVNLPSSGCVHGRNTSYVTISFSEKNGKTAIEPNVEIVEYDRDALEQALIKTNNPKPHFFGGIKRNSIGGENESR